MPIKEAWRLDRLRSGFVRLSCNDPHLNLVARLGPDSPRLTGGFGGWTVTGRPRQVGMTVWEGVDPYKLQFQLILDGGLAGWSVAEYSARAQSQEPTIRDLLAVSRGDSETPRPGIITIEGIPSLPSDRWVVDDLQFGTDAIRRTKDMHRIRVPVDFTLLEYSPPTYLPIDKNATHRNLGKTVTIKVKSGDTPARIARRRGCDWKDLRKLNPGVVKKSAQNLPDGIKIRVPAAEKKDRPRSHSHRNR